MDVSEPQAKEQAYGVFFDDGSRTYLVGLFDDEEEAERQAEFRDFASFQYAQQEYFEDAEEDEFVAAPEPKPEDFEGTHYVEEVGPELLTEDIRARLDRNFAVEVVG